MLSILLVAAALGQCAAVRPERLGAKVVSQVATIADLLEPVRAMAHSTRPIDRLAAFKAANGIVNKILLQSGNATKHMSESEQELLQKVVDLMESSIYASMDSSHKADESALGAAISDIEKCSSDIANRLAATGDLGRMHQSVRTKQSDLNDLQAVVDEKTAANTSAWEAFALHMSLIANPPEVPSFPARTMGALDVYFEKSPFCLWFTQQQEAYVVKRDAFVAADKALKEAIAAYDVKKAMRDVQYCDWKTELEEGCGAFEDCYSTKSDFYTKELKPRVTTDMQARIENFKAGETLVQQIKFLLAKSTSRETPTVDSSRYEVDFPPVPDQGTCDLSPLTSSEWVPTVQCEGEEELKPTITTPSCSGVTPTGSTKWINYGSNGVYVDVDTSACGFTATPAYVTSLGGSSSQWTSTGSSETYSATATKFRVYIYKSGITPAQANKWNWHLKWIAQQVGQRAHSNVVSCAGKTDAENTKWTKYGSNGVYVDVDSSSCGHSEKPVYITALAGSSSQWTSTGSSENYHETANGFRVYIHKSGITPAKAKGWKWHINWISRSLVQPKTSKFSSCAGLTTKGNTKWVNYNADGIYVDVDTTSCGFSATPMYTSALGGSSSQWTSTGSSENYQATEKKFRVYIHRKGITPAQANSWNWHINWIAAGRT